MKPLKLNAEKRFSHFLDKSLPLQTNENKHKKFFQLVIV
jgi:hypothetical protein